MSAVAAAARALVGAKFRLHGREAATGLDCVGVVLAALRGAGRVADAPDDYPLRGGDEARVAALLDAALTRVGTLAAGDVVLMRVGVVQLHLGVWTGEGLLHADAALRRVVERPGDMAWPVIGAWRFAAGMDPGLRRDDEECRDDGTRGA